MTTPAADPQLDLFLDALAHDLRNRVHAIGAALDVLDAYPPGSAEAQEARQALRRQAALLRTLADERLAPRARPRRP